MNITLWILTIGWIFVAIWIPFVIYTNRKAHPGALFILFGAEMWERFSYYGMRALLTLYMVKVLFVQMDPADADTTALGIYGSYTSMVYVLPVLGGLIADRILGFRKAIMFGGILMMLGHFALALEGMFFEGNMPLFFGSLALIIVGNGYFKPNISSFLGNFYEANDPRKDGAFTIFYMGVNIGAFLATLTCGYVGENISWHYGFGLAGIGMAAGLLVFWLVGPKYLGNEGLVPNPDLLKKRILGPINWQTAVFGGSILMVPLCASLLDLSELLSTVLIVVSLGIVGYLIYQGVTSKEKVEGQRLWVIVVLFFFHTIFWALFEQAGGSLTLFTDRLVNRSIGSSEIPASIFQSLNPFYIMILAPVFSWIWVTLAKRKKEPSTPMKFVLGLAQLGLGFIILVAGATYFKDSEGMVPMIFLFLMYLFHTTGELSLSPVGLSMITKLSPKKIVGFVMGFWFLSIALANKLSGEIGKLTAGSDSADGVVSSTAELIANYSDTYLVWGVYVVLGAAALLLVLVPTLRKWMNGIH